MDGNYGVPEAAAVSDRVRSLVETLLLVAGLAAAWQIAVWVASLGR